MQEHQCSGIERKTLDLQQGRRGLRRIRIIKEINAEEQLKNPDSVYNFYRKLIQLRHEEEIVVYGSFEMLMEDSEQIFAYQRVLEDRKLVVLCNFTPNHVALEGLPKNAEVMIGNYKNEGGSYLRSYEAVAYKMPMSDFSKRLNSD